MLFFAVTPVFIFRVCAIFLRIRDTMGVVTKEGYVRKLYLLI